MENLTRYFEELYRNFNERRIDLVIENMAGDIVWANGMEGGYVYGHKGVRDYWTRQFGLVSSNVQALEIQSDNGEVHIKVHQVVHDLKGTLLSDEIVEHIFFMAGGKITAFHLQN